MAEKEKKAIRKIKKYANRKMYDTTDKRYISLDKLGELIKEGEEVAIEDNETGEDLTASVVSQLLAREKKAGEDDDSSGVLVQLLRKGGGRVFNYAKRYTGLWQNAVTMAEDEVDKLVGHLVKEKEITESEGGKLKKEMKSHAENFKKWLGEKIDTRINEVLGVMNLATKDQVQSMTNKIEALTQQVEKLEKMSEKAVEEKAKTKAGPKAKAKPKAEAKAETKEEAKDSTPPEDAEVKKAS